MKEWFHILLSLISGRQLSERDKGALYCAFCITISIPLLLSLYIFFFTKQDDNFPLSFIAVHVFTLVLGALSSILVLKENFVARVWKKITDNDLFSKSGTSTEYLAEAYYYHRKRRLLHAVAILLFVSVAGIWLEDRTVLAATAAAIFVIFLHTFLTFYRVSKGYLGTNAFEVAELISFAIEETRGGNPPPGTRVVRTDGSSSLPEQDFYSEAKPVKI